MFSTFQYPSEKEKHVNRVEVQEQKDGMYVFF